MAMSTVWPGPISTVSGAAEKSMTRSFARLAWFSSTVRLRIVGSRSDRPTKPADVALACSAVHLRPGSVCELTSASARSMPAICRPAASAVPPLTPANTVTLSMPKVSTSTARLCAGSVRVAASVTVVLRFSTAKPPLTCTKPKASSVRLPVAVSIGPLAPGMSNVMPLAGPVATAMAVAPDA